MQSTIKTIALSILLVSNLVVLTMPIETFAATTPVKKTTAKLPTAKKIIAVKKVAAVKTSPKPVAINTQKTTTIFLPSGAIFRPGVKTTPAPTANVTPVLSVKKYTQTITNNKSIVLSGSEVMEIKKTHYIQTGSITLKDNARLIITDSLFEQRNIGNTASRLDAANYGQVVIKNSFASFSPWIVWRFTDNTELSINAMNVTTADGDANVYYEIDKNAKASVTKTIFIGSLTDKADVTIDRSERVSLNINLAGGAIVNEAFPKKISEYSFPGYDDHNVSEKIKITNSYAPEWGVMVYPTSDITIQNTEGLTIGFSVMSPWIGATATFEDLRPGYYADNKFNYSQTTSKIWDLNMKIHLIKTMVKSWNPAVGDDNTLILKNSEVAELPWSWGNSKIVLENSTAGFVRARQSVEITAKDSTITGDISAIEDGKINLIRTQVLGQKITRGKGQIVE